MADSESAIEITAELGYRDPRRAMAWLEAAFSFVPKLIVTEPSGAVSMIRMAFGDQEFALGQAPGDGPKSEGIYVRGRKPGAIDIAAHCARARAAGARIVDEPAQAFWGDMSYSAEDLEGRVWRFGQQVEGAGGPPPKGWKVEFLNRSR